MLMIHPEELTAIQRAGLVSMWLALGEAITPEQAASLLGYQRVREGEHLLACLSQVLPIYKRDGHWEMEYLSEIP